MNFNKAFVVGRLTRDPESRTLPSGQTVASFGLATNRFWTDQSGEKKESTEFHNIVAFGKLSDICSRYLNKGQLVLIEGRIQTSSWDDKDGNKRYRTEIVAENMQMGPRSGPAQNQNTPAQDQNPNLKDTEEIPVIEAEEPIPNQEEPAPDNSPQEESATKEEEVDVKNIPF
jgi:single-strand DNA-binding protein